MKSKVKVKRISQDIEVTKPIKNSLRQGGSSIKNTMIKNKPPKKEVFSKIGDQVRRDREKFKKEKNSGISHSNWEINLEEPPLNPEQLVNQQNDQPFISIKDSNEERVNGKMKIKDYLKNSAENNKISQKQMSS